MGCTQTVFDTIRATALVALAFSGAASAAPSKPAEMKAGRLPLVFVENRGQVDAQARFSGVKGGLQVYFTNDGFRTSLSQRDGEDGRHTFGTNLFHTFEGASQDVTLSGEKPLGGEINYLIGNDPSKWVSHLETYGAVRYHGLYSGVDMIVYDNNGKLEYDLELAPGADLSKVICRVDGGDSLSIDDAGRLVVATRYGELKHENPKTWTNNADGTRTEIDSKFVLIDSQRFGFAIPNRDPSASIVLDPGLTYGSYMGGTSREHGCGVSVDNDCDLYVAGDTQSADFPSTAGAFDSTYNAKFDTFVAKLIGTGTNLIYATFVGGSQGDFGHGVIVKHENAWVTGGADSRDFPVTAGAYDTTHNGGADMFLYELSADGSTLIFSTFVGGSGDEFSFGGQGVGVDPSDNGYVAGLSNSANFPTTPGCFQPVNAGSDDAFVTKFAVDGSALIYSTLIGGNNSDVANALDVDAAGFAYVGGFALSQNFPTTLGAFHTAPNGGSNGFLFKLNQTGTALVYSTFCGGSAEVVRGVAVDPTGECFVTGYTLSTVFPATPGAFDTTVNGNGDCFVEKFNPAGSNVVYASYFGGTGVDVGNGIDSDQITGDCYVTGWTESPFLPVTPTAFDSFYNGGPEDAYVIRVRADGSTLDYCTYLGGSGFDVAFAINTHEIGAVYVAGGTYSPDFPTGSNPTFDTTYNGDEDIFLVLMPAGPNACPYAPASSAYGTGFPGANGTPAWSNLSAPLVPSLALQLQLTNGVPNATVFVLVGVNPAAIPFSSGTLLVDPQIVVAAGVADGSGTFNANVPVVENPNYCGNAVYSQVFMVDPTLATFYQVVMSNGLKLTFGS